MMPTASPPVRQLVICCDGTNKTLTGRLADTNVLQVFEALAGTADTQQLLYYDPGVGAPDALPSIGIGDWLSRRWKRLSGLASGRGVFDNIGMAYQFLVEHYRPGDEIYLFGFSRGAFTVRCVAGMVNLFGLTRAEHVVLMPTLLQVYFAKLGTEGIERDPAKESMAGLMPGVLPVTREDVAAQIRASFTNAATRVVPVHFVGVWDTVASVGLPPFSLQISSNATVRGKCFRHVRQALALDEHRRSFLPRVFSENNFGDAQSAQSLVQQWFRGVHSDVGGGYRNEDSGLSLVARDWMVDQARQCGLRCPSPPQQNGADARALAHDPLFENALWAVTGMGVRNSFSAMGTDRRGITVVPVAHPSVATMRAASVWDHARSWSASLVLLIACAGFGWQVWQFLGAASHGQAARLLRVVGGAWWAPTTVTADPTITDPVRFAAALWLALLSLPAWLALIALPVSRAYARAVGWRQVGAARPWFDLLGLSLPISAAAGAVSLGLLLVSQWSVLRPLQVLFWWCASVALWLAVAGLIGCVVLILAGLRKAPRAPIPRDVRPAA